MPYQKVIKDSITLAVNIKDKKNKKKHSTFKHSKNVKNTPHMYPVSSLLTYTTTPQITVHNPSSCPTKSILHIFNPYTTSSPYIVSRSRTYEYPRNLHNSIPLVNNNYISYLNPYPTLYPVMYHIPNPASRPTLYPTLYLYAETYTPTYTPTYIPTCIPTYTPTYTPTCIPTYIPTYTPTYTPSYNYRNDSDNNTIQYSYYSYYSNNKYNSIVFGISTGICSLCFCVILIYVYKNYTSNKYKLQKIQKNASKHEYEDLNNIHIDYNREFKYL